MNFNPRSYKRSDKLLNCQPGDIMISIHAPTRGATMMGGVRLGKFKRFQSTLLQEERPCLKYIRR